MLLCKCYFFKLYHAVYFCFYFQVCVMFHAIMDIIGSESNWGYKDQLQAPSESCIMLMTVTDKKMVQRDPLAEVRQCEQVTIL